MAKNENVLMNLYSEPLSPPLKIQKKQDPNLQSDNNQKIFENVPAVQYNYVNLGLLMLTGIQSYWERQ